MAHNCKGIDSALMVRCTYQKYIMGITMLCCSTNPCHVEQPSCSMEKMKCRGKVGTGVRKQSKILHSIYSIYGELVYYVQNVFIMYWMGVSHVLGGCFLRECMKAHVCTAGYINHKCLPLHVPVISREWIGQPYS